MYVCVCVSVRTRPKYQLHMHKNGGAASESAAHDPSHLQHIQLRGRVDRNACSSERLDDRRRNQEVLEYSMCEKKV